MFTVTKFPPCKTIFQCRYSYKIASFDSKKDYYKILNCTQYSTQAEIKKEYYSLAKKYHPDVTSGKEEFFKEVNEAYEVYNEVLSDQENKQKYDSARQESNYSQKSYHEQSYQYTYSNNHKNNDPFTRKSRYEKQYSEEDPSSDYYNDKSAEDIFEDFFYRMNGQYHSQNDQNNQSKNRYQQIRQKYRFKQNQQNHSNDDKAYIKRLEEEMDFENFKKRRQYEEYFKQKEKKVKDAVTDMFKNASNIFSGFKSMNNIFGSDQSKQNEKK